MTAEGERSRRIRICAGESELPAQRKQRHRQHQAQQHRNLRQFIRHGVDGLADDIKDFSDKVKNLDLEIDADIYSTVPFDVAVSITPRDVEGNDLSDVIEYKNNNKLSDNKNETVKNSKLVSIIFSIPQIATLPIKTHKTNIMDFLVSCEDFLRKEYITSDIETTKYTSKYTAYKK